MSFRDDFAHRFLALLEEERERRRLQERAAAGGDPREVLIKTLDAMASRLRADPDYRPLTAAQLRKVEHQFEMFLKRRGYLRAS